MCGIFGAVSFSGAFEPADYDRFVCQTDLVAYRGPDDSDYQAFDVRAGTTAVEGGGFDAFLGHRRLSIIDLSSAGRQPMTDGAGRWLVFNGAIFNYVELREDLRRRGFEFRTSTDTEVILKLYAAEGEAGFSRMNGMWSVVLIDLPRRRVVLSRDRFSIKPLYYARVGERMYFGSEIKQLLPFLQRRAANRRIMHAYLTQGLGDHTEETFFEGVYAVRPKHNLVAEFDRGSVTETPYWSYARASTTPADAVEQFRDLLIDSVRIRLRSDVEVGALLSGGLDSSAIAVVADRVLGANLQTYSVVSQDPQYSEEPFIAEVAKTGIPNRRILFDSGGARDSLDAVIWHNDEPCASLSVVAQYRMLQRIKEETNLKVVLNGQGGDECLLGYQKFFFFHLLHLLGTGRLVPAFRLFFASWRKGTAVRSFKLAEAQRYLPIQRFKRAMPYVLSHGAAEPIHVGGNMRQRQMLDLDRYSVPWLAHFDDRNSMAHSLELRSPFLDHRLVEFALNLPVELKLHDGWSKYVLRRALPELPSAVRWRRDKQGFLTPEEAWLQHDLRPIIMERFGNGKSVLGQMELIDTKHFIDFYKHYLAGDRTVWYADVLRVLLAEVWAKRFLTD